MLAHKFVQNRHILTTQSPQLFPERGTDFFNPLSMVEISVLLDPPPVYDRHACFSKKRIEQKTLPLFYANKVTKSIMLMAKALHAFSLL